MTSLCVDAGVCRFHTTIRVCTNDEGSILFQIDSGCPHVKKIPDCLPADITPFDALRMPFSENPIYESCGKVLAHSACPVPSALIKAAEVAAGFGLKRNVCFTFEA
ncbi:hypothetical protein AOA80_07740 [Methanomassiliicoccales archaeon RumEn M1]|nr:hypothetical protein AOA80_07740 [Methanomassiliicoccales archaeon RumEn M1]